MQHLLHVDNLFKIWISIMSMDIHIAIMTIMDNIYIKPSTCVDIYIDIYISI